MLNEFEIIKLRKTFFTIMFCLALFSCIPKRKFENNLQNDAGLRNLKLLTNNNKKYWDLHFLPKTNVFGKGFCFYKDGKAIDYNYNDLGQRIIADYGDVEIEKLIWKINSDTLLIDGIYLYQIVKLNEDTLVLKDLFQKGGHQNLLFLRSKDQNSQAH